MQMILTVEQIKERIAPVVQKHGLSEVYLFGSYARGDAKETSDIDLLVNRTGTCLNSLFDMGGLYDDLHEAAGKPIDLITTCALEQQCTKKRSLWFINEVNKEKIQIV